MNARHLLAYTEDQSARNAHLAVADPALANAIASECIRQEDHLEMIASENYVSRAVLEAQGSALTNKYAEGYPGKRYYGGCEHVDVAEALAIERAKALFGAEHANVQPHSGSQANQAVYTAMLSPGDRVLGMSLSHGGHLTHGSPVNLSGKWFKFASYGLGADERIDYAEVERLARETKPRMIVAGASAYSRVIDWQRFRTIADEVGAWLMVDMAHYAGLIAAGVYPNPVGAAHFVTSTAHKTLRGPRSGFILTTAEHAKAIDSAIFPGLQGGPLMHVIAAKAVAFGEAKTEAFRAYGAQVVKNAQTLAQTLTDEGFRIVSGGTDCHMFLLDVRPAKLTGKAAEQVLGQAHITVNKNTIPNDPEKPFVTSGIRLGTAALTTRGFGIEQTRQVGQWIAHALKHGDDQTALARIAVDVKALCHQFPVYTN